ncbi:MAG: hypothetical protein COX43_02205 [Parcubacteria group bacterium CG23_combo_of_CG06-09_8_20_14_all_35_9]|nr:MAG: hypothetical protein COX43_02205 [Parcubacteria group bacterium CG23_combo_of_CG06-09_8_20_14_all_35_9]
MLKILIDLLIIIFLIIFQVSFLATFQTPYSNFNFILIGVIFIVFIISFKRALWWALIGGLILELYSIFTFGAIVFSLLLTLIIIDILFDKFFTNRSYYSFITLGLIGTLIYNGSLLGLNNFFYLLEINSFFESWNKLYLLKIFWQVILNVALLSITFLVYNYLKKTKKYS